MVGGGDLFHGVTRFGCTPVDSESARTVLDTFLLDITAENK